MGITHVVENISVIKRDFDRNVCYMGPDATSFLQRAPDSIPNLLMRFQAYQSLYLRYIIRSPKSLVKIHQ